MKINLNSPDGNIFAIQCKLYDELRKYYPCEAIEEWLTSVSDSCNSYDEMLEKLQSDWKERFEKQAGKLKFYKSKKYEMKW